MRKSSVPVVVHVEYFWVPVRTEKYKPLNVPVPKEPSRVQTCYNSVPGVKPDIQHPQHLVNVFYEDHVHDWNWRDGVLTYGSRVSDGGIWIRCEYDQPRYTVAMHADGQPPAFARPYKTLTAAKAQVTRVARSHRTFCYRAYDNATGESWRWNHQTCEIEKVP